MSRCQKDLGNIKEAFAGKYQTSLANMVHQKIGAGSVVFGFQVPKLTSSWFFLR